MSGGGDKDAFRRLIEPYRHELHAHCFDVESKLVARAPTTVLLTGRQPGLYEVETHETPLRLLMVAVR